MIRITEHEPDHLRRQWQLAKNTNWRAYATSCLYDWCMIFSLQSSIWETIVHSQRHGHGTNHVLTSLKNLCHSFPLYSILRIISYLFFFCFSLQLTRTSPRIKAELHFKHFFRLPKCPLLRVCDQSKNYTDATKGTLGFRTKLYRNTWNATPQILSIKILHWYWCKRHLTSIVVQNK